MPATLTDNQKAWVAELRSGNRTQTKQALKIVDNGLESFCCLGVASELSGLCIQRVSPHADGQIQFAEVGTEGNGLGDWYPSFPPPSVMYWLGAYAVEDYAESGDIHIDVPLEIASLPQQGLHEDARYWDDPNCKEERPLIRECMSAAELNDLGFTFSQIADVIEYFGIKQSQA